MISMRKKYRLKISNRMAGTAAMVLLMSSFAGPVRTPADQSAEFAAEQVQAQETTALEDVVDFASTVGQSGFSSFKISSLIFRF